uniref:Growth hormone secretagogue receptor type 1 n=1 Tax=Eptatretus burgeri TaxID=7764 RepID=A0A8C4R3I9_EPTBU
MDPDANVSSNWTQVNLDNPWESSAFPHSIFPLGTLLSITTTCALLFVVGVTGNVLTILVTRCCRDMRTTTNLYLSSMALSDLLIFLCMPFDLYRIWQYYPWIFGDFVCKLFQYVSEGCTYTTILHITALSVERYLAICFPLKAKVMVTKTRVKTIILAIWSLALLSASPVLVLVGVEFVNSSMPDKAICRETEFAETSGLLNTMSWVYTAYFFLPLLCMCVLYGLIGRKLWHNTPPGLGHGGVTAHRDRSHRQSVKILVVVVVAFVVCWLPFHVGRNLFLLTSNADRWLKQLSQYFNIVAIVFFYLSAAINPVLYNIVSRNYRTAACRLLLGAPDKHRIMRGRG